jgi:hypothetical protein
MEQSNVERSYAMDKSALILDSANLRRKEEDYGRANGRKRKSKYCRRRRV